MKSEKLFASGSLLNSPFDLETHLTYLDQTLLASKLIFSYAHNTLVGDICYDFKAKNLDGALDLNADNLNVFNLAHSIEGAAHAKLLFDHNKILVEAELEQIYWKNFVLPKARIEATWDQKQLNFELFFSQFSSLAPEYEVFPSLDFQIIGSASPQQIQAKGQLQGFGEAPLTLQLQLPILFSLNPLDVKINETAPFNLDIKGKGSINPLLRFLENASLIAKGMIDLDLNASGTWQDPQLEGHLSYTNGQLESLTTGAAFQDIQMEIQASGRELLVQNLSAHDLEKGELTGHGSISWNPKEGFPFALNLFTNRFLILALDPFTASVSAEMQITGNIHEIDITGSADLVKAHLAIPNKMPVQVPTVEVSYINALVTAPPESQNKKLIPIHWDIALNAPRNLIIDGRGLSSEWKGEMHISGEQNALEYTGKLKLVQGRFSIINRTFDLVEGKIRIEGTEAKNIHVDLRGDYELPTLTASIVITGTLDNTHLSFCSTPPMSTNQILSWILFNQDINELSPLQACRLASLLVSLSGKYSGPKTFSAIKEGLGIDVFSITDCDIDSADLTFQVGKYISQGTFVGINKSISGDFDSVLIQTRLYRDFFLEADYGGSLNGFTPNGGKVIFKWYKSY
ncbi:MAG: hypothetical protein S4CHLAM123_01870 [Chlamydiales bacterium]|nr:hypothetical protein [Chlamydiales bacterium]